MNSKRSTRTLIPLEAYEIDEGCEEEDSIDPEVARLQEELRIKEELLQKLQESNKSSWAFWRD